MAFTAFDDTQTVVRTQAQAGASGAVFPYDHLRQGVEITNTRHLYVGTQPKLWAGTNNFNDTAKTTNTVDHGVRIVTYGQALGFIEHDGHSRFKDLPKFDAATYLSMGDDYPKPILLNEGPMQQEECIIEPFVIPYRLKTNEGPIFSRRVRAELEDGNNFLDPGRSANRIQQFSEMRDPVTPVYFLDLGQEEFGGIRIDGFVTATQRLNYPFDDTQLESVVDKIDAEDSGLTGKLLELDINLDDDLRPFGYKSACAGFVYGTSAGTDSIAFGGTTRGA